MARASFLPETTRLDKHPIWQMEMKIKRFLYAESLMTTRRNRQDEDSKSHLLALIAFMIIRIDIPVCTLPAALKKVKWAHMLCTSEQTKIDL